MKEELNKRERLLLIDLLRRNLLYQTPKPVFEDSEAIDPKFVDLRFVFGQHQQILALIHKAGGWVMSDEDKQRGLDAQKAKIKQVYADGNNFDFSQQTYGELVMMYEELEGVDDLDLIRFRAEIKDVIADEIIGGNNVET